MKVEKEIAEKIGKMEEASRVFSALFNEIQQYFADEFDGCCIDNFYVTNEPYGDEQGGGEYCSQHNDSIIPDAGCGTYYFPIDGTDVYIAVEYSF